MTQEQMDDLKAVSIKICLQGHLYAIDLGEKFGPAFTDHESINFAISGIILERDPQAVLKLVDSDEIETMLDVVQGHEELVLATIHDRNPVLDTKEIRQYAESFDEQLFAFWARAYAARALADEPTPMAKVADELARRGIGDTVTASLSRRSLRARIKERRLRRAWLRSHEGRQYLTKLARRRRHHHHVDQQKSKTAKLSAKLYSNER